MSARTKQSPKRSLKHSKKGQNGCSSGPPRLLYPEFPISTFLRHNHMPAALSSQPPIAQGRFARTCSTNQRAVVAAILGLVISKHCGHGWSNELKSFRASCFGSKSASSTVADFVLPGHKPGSRSVVK